ncbi:hypothetical protein [Billgrantia saliphila]|uniref:hypothetical protein n=1 Tax=Billgrantia saliphila TaxID=1848458 RepID=UPI000CE44FAA|nr:hypothetical protein [Halomonas saliphila]
MERLSDYIQGERVVRELRRHAPEALEELACNLQQPLSPPLERAIARSLKDRRVPDFSASEVLMPVMMKAFEVSPAVMTQEELAELEANCNCCEVVGRCWQAMRSHTDVEACCDFCPNAEAFMGHRGE